VKQLPLGNQDRNQKTGPRSPKSKEQPLSGAKMSEKSPKSRRKKENSALGTNASTNDVGGIPSPPKTIGIPLGDGQSLPWGRKKSNSGASGFLQLSSTVADMIRPPGGDSGGSSNVEGVKNKVLDLLTFKGFSSNRNSTGSPERE
jgi:hypothetical protein